MKRVTEIMVEHGRDYITPEDIIDSIRSSCPKDVLHQDVLDLLGRGSVEDWQCCAFVASRYIEESGILGKPIAEFVSVRTRNVLAANNIKTVGELVDKTKRELLAMQKSVRTSARMGETGLKELEVFLAEHGISLNP